jgi:hypothetical protein
MGNLYRFVEPVGAGKPDSVEDIVTPVLAHRKSPTAVV